MSERTRMTQTAWVLGIEARIRALLSDGRAADICYRKSIEWLGQTRIRAELGRSHLLYGEWLRRQRRRRDARDQLASAYQIFDSAGAAAFAERARIELRAAGGHAQQPAVAMPDILTSQEALIARLAADGASNPEIAAQLFISRATVAYHLRKVFTKLDVSSRNRLAPVLPARQGAAPPVTPQN
jgi:DNA-binding CsgD family transcriptional regulator